jgi:hypothetical protein
VDTAVDIKAAYSENTAGVVRTFAAVRPPFSQDPPSVPLDCTTAPPDTMFFTAGVPEQLVIFDVPRHIDVNQTLLSAIDVDNSVGQAMTGSSQHYLFTSAPSGGLGCGPRQGLAGVETMWELNPGEKMMICVRNTLRFVHDARFMHIESPTGTYRSVLSIGSPTGPDGSSFCDESADADQVLGYGVDGSTVEASLWDGHFAAGQQIVLRVDARNTTTDRRTGRVAAELN